MSELGTEYFIARKMTNSKLGVMQRIAGVSIAIGVCVMILAISVILGFKSELLSSLTILGSTAKITSIDSRGAMETKPIERELSLESALRAMPEVKNINAYASKTGVLKTSNAIEGVLLKGVDSQYDSVLLSSLITQGRMPRLGDSLRYKDLLISQSLALKLTLDLGDRVELMFLSEQGQTQRDKYAITGIFDSAVGKNEAPMLFTDIRNVQKLNQWTYDQISGYEVNSNGKQELSAFSEKVFATMLDARSTQGLVLVDLNDSFPMIFDWLKAHNINGAVIISIMLVVAIFNMLSALLIILLERTSMIGVLKALGMRSGALQRIFILHSSRLILKSMLWGNFIGLALAMTQKYTKFITLDADGYFLSHVPITLSWGWLVALNFGVFVFVLLSQVLPTRIILRIKPDITLRYK